MTTIDSDNAPLVSTISTRTDSQEDRMATSSTKTTEPQHVDLDGDGEADVIVSQSTTTTPIERKKKPEPEPEPVVEEKPAPVAQTEPRPEVRASGDPGECGETDCWQRTALTFTNSNVGRTYTFTPPWKGNIAWDFGDGSPVRVGRGPVVHGYSSAGAKTVKASPVASSCLKPGTVVVTVV